MTLSNVEVIMRWCLQQAGQNRSLSTDGESLYSYALRIGVWQGGWPVVFNYTWRPTPSLWRDHTLPPLGSRSQTTTRHVYAALYVARRVGIHNIHFRRQIT